MAQNFELPVSFEFTHQRRSWHACAFSVVERDQLSAAKTVFPALIEPLMKRSDFLVKLHGCNEHIVSTSPRAVLFDTYAVELGACFEALHNLRFSQKPIPESLSKLLISFDQGLKPGRKGDPWRMREEFMNLEETNAALLWFLRRWGSLGADQLAYGFTPQTDFILARTGEERFECVLPLLAWERRKQLREGLLQEPDAWLSQHAALGFTHQRPSFPYIGIEANNCYRAIELSITLDHLRRVKSRVCARPDCDNIFIVDSNHGRIYCAQYCAHLVSVRKGRETKKKTKDTGKRREA